MSFTKTIRATAAGTSAGPFTIYHTSISVGNILASGVSRASLLAGVLVTIPDGATVVIVKSDPPCGNSVSVSVSPVGAPGEQAIDIVFSAKVGTQMNVSWTNGTGAKRAVFIKAASSGSPSPVNGTTYTPNTVFGSGTQIGVSGWYCIYNGTGSSVTVTGLTASTDYRVMVCEYNGAPGSEVYNVTSAANNPNTGNSGTAISSTATLLFDNYGDGIFRFTVSSPLSEDVSISGASVQASFATDCSAVDDTDDIGGTNNPGRVLTILAGSLSGELASLVPVDILTTSYKKVNSITILGLGTFVDGNTLTIGSTLVTVSIPSTCNIYGTP